MNHNLGNAGKPWTPEEMAKLKQEVKQNTPTRVLALKHQRSEAGIRNKAQEKGISLKPVNQRPYGTSRKKAP